jgi:hypothetical protein
MMGCGWLRASGVWAVDLECGAAILMFSLFLQME